jgi:hypothetical protein
MPERAMIGMALAAFMFGFAAMLVSRAASAALFSSPPQAHDILDLSPQQQQAAWNDLGSMPSDSGPVTFQPSTSSAVPSTVQVHAIRGKAATDVPTLAAYDVAKVHDKLLIINPNDMMIVALIGH